MRIRIICICLILFFSWACYLVNVKEKTSQNKTEEMHETCSNISSETAILIAKGLLFLDYNLKNYEVSIKEDEDFFEVSFSRLSEKTNVCCGGNPSVVIRKTTGEIVSYKTGK
jgi:hypothetical protein